MRSSLRVLTITSVLVALLLPAVAYAAGGPFYTTSDPNADTNGNGISLATIRGVDEDMGKLQEACKYFYTNQGGTAGSWVYWHDTNAKQWYRFKMKSDGSCSPSNQPTAPPKDGVPVTPPFIVGSLLTLGFLLIGSAWLLRRRSLRST